MTLPPAAPGTGAQAGASTAEVLPLPGTRLAYQVTGGGPAVVLVHGFGLDMRMWDPQVADLAARFRGMSDGAGEGGRRAGRAGAAGP